MKNLLFLFLIILYSCSSPIKKQEPVKPMSTFECIKESGRWSEISHEYIQKQMHYVGRNDMTPEDHAKFNEYSTLGKMASDSARFYWDKFNMLRRIEELQKKYDDLK